VIFYYIPVQSYYEGHGIVMSLSSLCAKKTLCVNNKKSYRSENSPKQHCRHLGKEKSYNAFKSQEKGTRHLNHIKKPWSLKMAEANTRRGQAVTNRSTFMTGTIKELPHLGGSSYRMYPHQVAAIITLFSSSPLYIHGAGSN